MQFGMNERKVKQISVYLKAGRNAATPYYRFYQFFDGIEAEFHYHLMIPDNRWNLFFPISIQPLWKKIVIFLYIYIRVLKSLFVDVICKPDFIVISRCLINKLLPYSYKLFLLFAKKRGINIIYDFDDQVLALGEISFSGFQFLTRIADIIVVGSPLLKDIVDEHNKEKTLFLPTTDGDIHNLLTNEINKDRLSRFNREIRVVWVGTFTGLENISVIIEAFEKIGTFLLSKDKRLVFTVVCDQPLDYIPKFFCLNNVKWSHEKAIEMILKAHVGVMPLKDNEFTRGKCSFKLIQYLSAGLPILGTRVGMNKIVLTENVGIGLDNNNVDEWAEALLKLIRDVNTWQTYSKKASVEWNEKYSFTSNFMSWKNILLNL